MKSTKPYSKILLIRPEMLGDTILMTSVASSIKHSLPETEIYMLLKPSMDEVIKNNGDIKGWITTKKELNLFGVIILAQKLKNEKFDAAIVFEDNPTPQFALACLLAGIKTRIGDKARVLYGWMYNKGIWINSADPTLHHIELYLKLLEPLGIKNCRMPLKIHLDKKAENNIRNILPSDLSSGQTFIGLHVGTGGGNKALLPKTYAEISDLIQEKTNCKVIMIGGYKEIETLKIIKQITRKPFIDLVGKLSIQELFSVISKLGLFIGVDSGPMHAAAAFKIPTVAIYTANDVNPSRWLPWMTKYSMIKSQNDCKLKCSHRKCKFDYCLTAIKPEKVVSSSLKLLHENQ